MDIHPPDGPTHSFRDFAIHIAVVTVGILIALSLEGIREVVREHAIVREARENFRREAESNRKNIVLELENTRTMSRQINAILNDIPNLRQHPDQLQTRVAEIQPSFYFFSSTRWESALSTGALGHMTPAEVNLYANENTGVHAYMSLESEATPIYIQLNAYFRTHPNPTPEEFKTGVEKLIIFQSYAHTMVHVGEELQSGINDALGQK